MSDSLAGLMSAPLTPIDHLIHTVQAGYLPLREDLAASGGLINHHDPLSAPLTLSATTPGLADYHQASLAQAISSLPPAGTLAAFPTTALIVPLQTKAPLQEDGTSLMSKPASGDTQPASGQSDTSQTTAISADKQMSAEYSLASASTSTDPEPIIIVGNPPSTGTGDLPVPPIDGSPSTPIITPEQVSVVGQYNGYEHVVSYRGVFYLSNGQGGIVSNNVFGTNADGSSTVGVSPTPLDVIEQRTAELYQNIFGRALGDPDRQWISDMLYNGTHWSDIMSTEAISDESTQDLKNLIQDVQGRPASDGDIAYINSVQSREASGSDSLNSEYSSLAIWTGQNGGYDPIIEGVQNRDPNANDSGWTVSVEEGIGNRSATYTSERNDLINFSGESGVIDQSIYNAVHGREAQQADLDYARGQMLSGLTIQQVINNEAHNSETTSDLSGFLNQTGISNSNSSWESLIDNTEMDIGSQELNLLGAYLGIETGSALVSSSTYTVVDGQPPNATLYTAGNNQQFYMPSNYSFAALIEAGKNAGQQYVNESGAQMSSTIPTGGLNGAVFDEAFYNLKNNIVANIGQGGVFDIQRNNQTMTTYSGMVPGANYNVGVFMAAAGFSLEATIVAASTYAVLKSGTSLSQSISVISTDVQYWTQGWTDYNSGKLTQ